MLFSKKYGNVSTSMLIKGVLLLNFGPLVIIFALFISDNLELEYCVYSYLGIFLSTAVFILPFLANLQSLTQYVDDLAGDRRVDAPDLKILAEIGPLASAVRRLHRSWEKRKQEMESMLSEREILVDTIPDLLIMIDSELNIVRTNSSARLRFGQSLANHPLKEVVADESLMSTIRSVLEDFRGREHEFYIPEPFDCYFRAKIERFPVHSRGGIAAIITLHDITELKKTEQMRADFVANASHEIRTPLASIIGFIETLQGPAKNDPSAVEQFLKIMSEQALRMRKLVNDLLSLSKIEMSISSIPTEKVNLSSIVERVKRNSEWQASQRNIVVISEIDSNIPDVNGDEGELQQVLQNFVENSIKYGSADSEIKIKVRISERFPRDKNLLGYKRVIAISVIDKGEGIPKEHLPRLTERFYRIDTARSRKIGGTGLGLAIVKHIINRHRGAIQIESQIGVGSIFTIYLPYT